MSWFISSDCKQWDAVDSRQRHQQSSDIATLLKCCHWKIHKKSTFLISKKLVHIDLINKILCWEFWIFYWGPFEMLDKNVLIFATNKNWLFIDKNWVMAYKVSPAGKASSHPSSHNPHWEKVCQFTIQKKKYIKRYVKYFDSYFLILSVVWI